MSSSNSHIVPAASRYLADHDWLRSYHLFSFADYYDPANVAFGNLRVFNDDHIAAESGFPMHPHRDMEIVTLVLSGAVTHADTMGSHGRVRAGEVQRMSAGVGVFHSEENAESEPLHLYQIWFVPEARGRVPSYRQRDFPIVRNELQALVSPHESGALDIGADVSLYRADYDADGILSVPVAEGRGIFVYMTE
jgi:quercetin 2,3-dioxygenase